MLNLIQPVNYTGESAKIINPSTILYIPGVNRRLTYKISGGIVDEEFEIDPMSGLVTLKTSDLDREVKSSYILTGKKCLNVLKNYFIQIKYIKNKSTILHDTIK